MVIKLLGASDLPSKGSTVTEICLLVYGGVSNVCLFTNPIAILVAMYNIVIAHTVQSLPLIYLEQLCTAMNNCTQDVKLFWLLDVYDIMHHKQLWKLIMNWWNIKFLLYHNHNDN